MVEPSLNNCLVSGEHGRGNGIQKCKGFAPVRSEMVGRAACEAGRNRSRSLGHGIDEDLLDGLGGTPVYAS